MAHYANFRIQFCHKLCKKSSVAFLIPETLIREIFLTMAFLTHSSLLVYHPSAVPWRDLIYKWL